MVQELFFQSLAVASLVLSTTAHVHFQLPPFDSVEVTNGSSTTIIHKTWFNTSEQSLLLYLRFNRVFYPVPGSFLDGNLLVDYSTTCQKLSCEREFFEMFTLPAEFQAASSEGVRCETIRVTLLGHEEIDHGMLQFHLFESNMLSSDLIGSVRVNVAGPQQDSGSVTTSSQVLTDSSSLSTSETITEGGQGSDCQSDESMGGDGHGSNSSGVIVYALAAIFLLVTGFDLTTVGVLLWGVRRRQRTAESTFPHIDHLRILTHDMDEKTGE